MPQRKARIRGTPRTAGELRRLISENGGQWIEGSFGFNLELVAERTDGHYQHYWRDAGGWNEGVVII